MNYLLLGEEQSICTNVFEIRGNLRWWLVLKSQIVVFTFVYSVQSCTDHEIQCVNQ